MANIKSQIKRNRQNEKAPAAQQVGQVVAEDRHPQVQRGRARPATPRRRPRLLRDASRKLDKAVSKGVIHKNQAANRKSAIAKRLASLSA